METMRKVIVSMNVTLDGFMSGENGELDWHFQYWTKGMGECLADQLSEADTILLGRKTYEVMADYFPKISEYASFHLIDQTFIMMMNRYSKIVFSSTLRSVHWSNSTLVKSDFGNAVYALKQKTGRDIIVYGSATLVQLLVDFGLVDEYCVWVHPVAIRKGRRVVNEMESYHGLQLTESKPFASGVVLFRYHQVVKNKLQGLTGDVYPHIHLN